MSKAVRRDTKENFLDPALHVCRQFVNAVMRAINNFDLLGLKTEVANNLGNVSPVTNAELSQLLPLFVGQQLIETPSIDVARKTVVAIEKLVLRQPTAIVELFKNLWVILLKLGESENLVASGNSH